MFCTRALKQLMQYIKLQLEAPLVLPLHNIGKILRKIARKSIALDRMLIILIGEYKAFVFFSDILIGKF